MRTTLYDYCREQDRPELLREWNQTKNAPLTPKDISRGSKRSVWWKCEKGHEWQAMVYTRSGAGSGCPYCMGRKAWPGTNDLASQRPDLAAQWHPTKNRGRTPAEVTVGGHYKAWWICEKGHEWQAIVKSRAINGTGCPVCANRKLTTGENDLAVTHPELARQWHPTKNGALTPPRCGGREPPQGLVAVREGPRVAGHDPVQGRERRGLPGLRGKGGDPRRE